MKKKFGLSLVIAGVLVLSPVYSVSKAEAPAPGSSGDPVITKSYFDQNTLTEAKVNQLVASAIAKLPNGGSNSGGTSTGAVGSTAALTVVQLKAGQTLYAGAGAEFIVRTGKTVAVSNDEDGIPDVTSGKDIPAGAAIENNHHLIFPRDTRGIRPAPKNIAEIYVMVRGNYLLLNADGSKVTS